MRWFVRALLRARRLRARARAARARRAGARGAERHASRACASETGSARLTAARLGLARELLRAALERDEARVSAVGRARAPCRACAGGCGPISSATSSTPPQSRARSSPTYLELGFGFDADDGRGEASSLPALELAPGSRLRGRIDRVDVERRRARRSSTTTRAARAARPRSGSSEGKLQVALYMRAVEELLGLRVVGGFYQPLSGGDLRARGRARRRQRRASSSACRGDAREHDEVQELLEEALAAAREAVARPARRARRRGPRRARSARAAAVPRRSAGASADGGRARPSPPAGSTLTDEQEQAVARRSEPLLLSRGRRAAARPRCSSSASCRAVREDGDRARAKILAITFTERAAGELRERVRERACWRSASARPRATPRPRSSGTFHGFCARLLRAHPLPAGLDPDFAILDEGLAARLRERAFTSGAAGLPRGRAQREPVDLVAAYGVDRVRAMIEGVHARLRSRGQRLPQAPAGAPADGRARTTRMRATRPPRACCWTSCSAGFGRAYEELKRDARRGRLRRSRAARARPAASSATACARRGRSGSSC